MDNVFVAGVNVGGMIGGAMANAMNNNLSGQSAQVNMNSAQAGNQADGVACPSCKTILPKGAKFCFECGMKLAGNTCPSCGNPIVAGAKFCLECGQKL